MLRPCSPITATYKSFELSVNGKWHLVPMRLDMNHWPINLLRDKRVIYSRVMISAVTFGIVIGVWIYINNEMINWRA